MIKKNVTCSNHVIPLTEEQILTFSTWEQTGANIINDPRLYYGSPPKLPYKIQNVSYIPFVSEIIVTVLFVNLKTRRSFENESNQNKALIIGSWQL